MKERLSSFVGYIIILVSSLIKIPVIRNIMKNKSVNGMNKISIIIEILSYTAMLIYNIMIRAPISTYGELIFILLQNFFIFYLLLQYDVDDEGTKADKVEKYIKELWIKVNRDGFVNEVKQELSQLSSQTFEQKKAKLLVAYDEINRNMDVYFIASYAFLSVIFLSLPYSKLYLLTNFSMICSIVGKFPQIHDNYKTKNTGVQSIITQGLLVIGGFTRLATIMVQVDDINIKISHILSLVLGIIILVQIIIYGNQITGSGSEESSVKFDPSEAKAFMNSVFNGLSNENLKNKFNLKPTTTVVRTIGYVTDTSPDDKLYAVNDAALDAYSNRIFISSQDGATNADELKSKEISHILNVAIGIENKYEGLDGFNIVYKTVPFYDDPEFKIIEDDGNIAAPLQECILFLDEAFSNQDHQPNVLVHCNAGVSRSASVIIAYLMSKRNLTFDQALEILKASRPSVRPNDGFTTQLKLLETRIVSQPSESPEQ